MPKFPTADEWGNTRTPYAVVCSAGCGLVYLTADEYGFQLNRPTVGMPAVPKPSKLERRKLRRDVLGLRL